MLLFHSRVLFPFCFALQWDDGIGEDWMPAPPRRLLLLLPLLSQILSLGSSVDKSHLTKLPNTSVNKKKHSEATNVFHVTGWQTKKTSPAALSLRCVVESVGLHVGPSDCPLDS